MFSYTGNPGKVGGTKLTEISKVMVIVQMEDAQKVLNEAREASQKHLSKDEIQRIKDKADEVLGSMVQCSSEVLN